MTALLVCDAMAHMLALRALVVLLGLLVAAPSLVSAQAPPDVVRLRDGGMLRGTIAEHEPESHVSIVLPTGEVRRVPASEVLWAGPADEMPPAGTTGVTTRADYSQHAVPAPDARFPSPSGRYGSPGPLSPGVLAPGTLAPPGMPVATGTVPVRFEADREDVRVDLRVGTRQHLMIAGNRYGVSSRIVQHPVWQELCLAPCTQEMTTGRFHIGVSLGGKTYPLPEAVEARVPTRVNIHWGDRYAIRVIGAVIWAVVGALGTAGLIVTGMECMFGWQCPADLLLASGVGVAVATAVGLPMVFLKDEISFQVGPL